MLDLAQINSVLKKQLDISMVNIQQNMITNNQVATGRAKNSLNVNVGNSEGSISGLDYIDTLETGISPQRSQMVSWKATNIGLHTWYQAKGYNTGKPNYRRIAAATTNQREMGSVLYRELKGNRRPNVYTNEANLLVERIKNEIGEVIINTKILS